MSSVSLTAALEETLALFETAGEPQTTPEVSESLDLERRTAYARLERLVEAGHLETKKVGASARVWWREANKPDSRGGREHSEVSDLEHDERGSQQQDYTEELLETAPVGVMTIEEDGTFRTANRQAAKLLEVERGDDRERIVGINAVYDENGAFLSVEERPYIRVFETGEPVRNEHIQLEPPDGERQWLSTNVEPITDENGDVDQALVTMQDISQLKDQADRLERQRDELEVELDEMFERVEDGFYALDDQWRFTYVNEQARELIDFTGEGLVGKRVWEEFEWAADSNLRREYEKAMETQEPTSFELFYPDPLDAWYEINAYPSETGLSVYFQEITERKEREQELERTLDLLHAAKRTADVGGWEIDPETMDVFWSDHLFDLLNRPQGKEPALEEALDVYHEEDRPRVGQAVNRALEGGEAFDIEVRYLTPEGEVRWLRVQGVPETGGDEVVSLRGAAQDITQRKRRERELEKAQSRYQTLIENFPNGAVAIVGEDLRYAAFGGTPAGDTDLTRAGIEGLHLSELPQELEAVVAPHYEAALGGETSKFETTVDDRTYQFHFVPIRDEDGDVFAAVGMSQDVTERKEREHELETRIRQQAVVTDLGQSALEDRELDGLMAEASRLVAETLDNEYCKVLDLDEDADELLLRQGVGWDEGIVGQATVSLVDNNSQAAYTLANDEPIVVEDLDTESRFSGPDLLTSHDVKSGISVVIGSHENPWGILGTHDIDQKEFTDQDVNFVRSVANILATAIHRHRNEQELRRQREELFALNNLNTIVSEITETAIGKSTREEIEQAVCDVLAAAESYEFAWFAEVDPQTDTFEPSVTAGTRGYAEEIRTSLDPDDPHGQGPGARAIREQETQVVQDVFADPAFEPWRDAAEKYGFSSLAAIPIEHDETLYGVLGVYADRPNAFDAAERTVISRLGEVIAHAIASVERKRALTTEEVVELTFQNRNVFDELDIPADPLGTITVEELVPLEDGEFLLYGTATRDSRESMKQVVESLDRWETLSFHEESGDTSFELLVSEHSILSMLASLGGRLEEAVIEEGDYRLTVHFAPGTDIRRFIDTVQEIYPGVEMVTRRQTTRTNERKNIDYSVIETSLTDRQRATLQAAYHSGFFEWPRDSSGQDVADSLGIAPPTFHYHLRRAQQKVVESALSAGEEEKPSD